MHVAFDDFDLATVIDLLSTASFTNKSKVKVIEVDTLRVTPQKVLFPCTSGDLDPSMQYPSVTGMQRYLGLVDRLV